jgi:hypothetical protein
MNAILTAVTLNSNKLRDLMPYSLANRHTGLDEGVNSCLPVQKRITVITRKWRQKISPKR